MATPPTKSLLSRDSTDKPQAIAGALMAQAQVNDEDCPWVEINKLYVSVTITGENSWLPLISLLHSKGHKKFAIITGRHGDIPNVYLASSRETLHVFDQEHVGQDSAKRTKALGEFSDITITLLDAGEGKVEQKNWLITKSSELINSDHIVIFGWCYSLFSLCQVPKMVKDNEALYNSTQMALISRPIKGLTDQFFGWVPA